MQLPCIAVGGLVPSAPHQTRHLLVPSAAHCFCLAYTICLPHSSVVVHRGKRQAGEQVPVASTSLPAKRVHSIEFNMWVPSRKTYRTETAPDAAPGREREPHTVGSPGTVSDRSRQSPSEVSHTTPLPGSSTLVTSLPYRAAQVCLCGPQGSVGPLPCGFSILTGLTVLDSATRLLISTVNDLRRAPNRNNASPAHHCPFRCYHRCNISGSAGRTWTDPSNITAKSISRPWNTQWPNDTSLANLLPSPYKLSRDGVLRYMQPHLHLPHRTVRWGSIYEGS